MPWCEECSKYWTPNSMTDEGTCPRCGETIAETTEAAAADDEKTPWHFKLLVVAVVAYLVWRTIDIFA